MRKGRSVRDIPPPLELECLAALWTLGEGTVQAVRDLLAPKRTLAYTTVMTMLDRLMRKQVIARRKNGRSFVYKPIVSRDDVRGRAVRELVDALFDGDHRRLQAYLTRTTVTTMVITDGAIPPEADALDAALL